MKTGRNLPCPCGSGKKYKQCHGHFRFSHYLSFYDKKNLIKFVATHTNNECKSFFSTKDSYSYNTFELNNLNYHFPLDYYDKMIEFIINKSIGNDKLKSINEFNELRKKFIEGFDAEYPINKTNALEYKNFAFSFYNQFKLKSWIYNINTFNRNIQIIKDYMGENDSFFIDKYGMPLMDILNIFLVLSIFSLKHGENVTKILNEIKSNNIKVFEHDIEVVQNIVNIFTVNLNELSNNAIRLSKPFTKIDDSSIIYNSLEFLIFLRQAPYWITRNLDNENDSVKFLQFFNDSMFPDYVKNILEKSGIRFVEIDTLTDINKQDKRADLFFETLDYFFVCEIKANLFTKDFINTLNDDLTYKRNEFKKFEKGFIQLKKSNEYASERNLNNDKHIINMVITYEEIPFPTKLKEEILKDSENEIIDSIEDSENYYLCNIQEFENLMYYLKVDEKKFNFLINERLENEIYLKNQETVQNCKYQITMAQTVGEDSGSYKYLNFSGILQDNKLAKDYISTTGNPNYFQNMMDDIKRLIKEGMSN